MADFTDTIEVIDHNIVPHNNARTITGQKLNTTLKEMVNDVNEKKLDNYSFASDLDIDALFI